MAELTQHFILHPIDEDLWLGTPVLGYPHAVLPGPEGHEELRTMNSELRTQNCEL